MDSLGFHFLLCSLPLRINKSFASCSRLGGGWLSAGRWRERKGPWLVCGRNWAGGSDPVGILLIFGVGKGYFLSRWESDTNFLPASAHELRWSLSCGGDTGSTLPRVVLVGKCSSPSTGYLPTHQVPPSELV